MDRHGDDLDIWHVEVDGASQGPFSRHEVTGLIERGCVGANARVWQPGDDGWTILRESPLAALLPPPPLSKTTASTRRPSRRGWVVSLVAGAALVAVVAAVAATSHLLPWQQGEPASAQGDSTTTEPGEAESADAEQGDGSPPTLEENEPASQAESDPCEDVVADAEVLLAEVDEYLAAEAEVSAAHSWERYGDMVLANESCFSSDELANIEYLRSDNGEVPDQPLDYGVTLNAGMQFQGTCAGLLLLHGQHVTGRVYGDGVLLANFSAPNPDPTDNYFHCMVPIEVDLPSTAAWQYELKIFDHRGDERQLWLQTRQELERCNWDVVNC